MGSLLYAWEALSFDISVSGLVWLWLLAVGCLLDVLVRLNSILNAAEFDRGDRAGPSSPIGCSGLGCRLRVLLWLSSFSQVDLKRPDDRVLDNLNGCFTFILGHVLTMLPPKSVSLASTSMSGQVGDPDSWPLLASSLKVENPFAGRGNT